MIIQSADKMISSVIESHEDTNSKAKSERARERDKTDPKNKNEEKFA